MAFEEDIVYTLMLISYIPIVFLVICGAAYRHYKRYGGDGEPNWLVRIYERTISSRARLATIAVVLLFFFGFPLVIVAVLWPANIKEAILLMSPFPIFLILFGCNFYFSD